MFYDGGKTFKAMDNRSLLGAESHVSYNTSSLQIVNKSNATHTYFIPRRIFMHVNIMSILR